MNFSERFLKEGTCEKVDMEERGRRGKCLIRN